MSKNSNFLRKDESKRGNKTFDNYDKFWKESVIKLMIYQQLNNLK